MQKDFSKFKASDDCKTHDQLLHYTSFDVLKIMLNSRTLKCNSLKNVNDRLEREREGIEDLIDASYVSCFCHYQYEIVPFWFMYGGSVLDSKKVLLRFKNFANFLENVIESDWAFTGENKIIYFNPQKLFEVNIGGISCYPIDNPLIEKRQTIKTVRLFDIEYLLPDHEAFSKKYKIQGNVSFDEGQSLLPAIINDARSIGKHKTIHWEYEAETRIQCKMNPFEKCYFDYILLRLKDDIYRDMGIIANPWASDDFISDIKTALLESTLPRRIKETIIIKRSELDGQIVGKDQ